MRMKLGQLRKIIREAIAQTQGSALNENYGMKWYGGASARVAAPGTRYYGAEGAANDKAYASMIEALKGIGIGNEKDAQFISGNFTYVTAVGRYYDLVGGAEKLAGLLDLALAGDKAALKDVLVELFAGGKNLPADPARQAAVADVNAGDLIKIVSPMKGKYTGSQLAEAFEAVGAANEMFLNDPGRKAQQSAMEKEVSDYERSTGRSFTAGT